MEMLPDSEELDDHPEDVTIIGKIRGIEREDCHAPHLPKTVALEIIDDQNNSSEWIFLFALGSYERAMKSIKAGTLYSTQIKD